MRTRKEIEKDDNHVGVWAGKAYELPNKNPILEVLLDIRDLLTPPTAKAGD